MPSGYIELHNKGHSTVVSVCYMFYQAIQDGTEIRGMCENDAVRAQYGVIGYHTVIDSV